MNVIEVKGLTKKFGKKVAVNNINFSVEKGEVFGFLGPNGAGKTTTIRCLMDFIRPTSGSANIFGLEAKKDSVELKKRIGYLAGDVRFYDKWTGKDHFDYIQSIRGKSANLKDLINKLDFDSLVPARQLSSGGKQKLGLIMTFMHQPELLILDEPTTALDPFLQNRVYDILKEQSSKGVTVFMSSHNLPEVEKICSKVSIIKEGSLVATESISALKDKKMHTVTVYFKKAQDKKNFKIKGLKDAEDLVDGLKFNVKGEIGEILAELSGYDLKDAEISRASLENIFLEFYKRD
jgi:ABC-2 type transport system ATP-binding protein